MRVMPSFSLMAHLKQSVSIVASQKITPDEIYLREARGRQLFCVPEANTSNLKD
jgi:hypothetical protein